MELIEPAYIQSQNGYETVSYFWYILIQNNKIINPQLPPAGASKG